MANDIQNFGDITNWSGWKPPEYNNVTPETLLNAKTGTNNGSTSNIEQNPDYTEGAGLLDTQQTNDQNTLNTQRTGVVNSYAQSRQNAINSYQDALDAINYQAKQVGIRVQAGSAQRGLYNASGELSGIGQGVASNAIEPLVRQTRIAGERQAQNLANLSVNEQNALKQVDDAIASLPGKTAQAKAALKAKITQSIIDAADKQNKRNLDLAKFNLDVSQENRMARSAAANIPGTLEYRQKIKVDQQEKGRTHLDSPSALQSATKAGKTIITINGMKFALSAKEEADLRKIKVQTNKTLSTKPISDKVTQTMKNDYNQSLLGLGDVVVTSGQPGQGQLTREQAATILAQNYPWLSIKDIKKQVYETYPDTYR